MCCVCVQRKINPILKFPFLEAFEKDAMYIFPPAQMFFFLLFWKASEWIAVSVLLNLNEMRL